MKQILPLILGLGSAMSLSDDLEKSCGYRGTKSKGGRYGQYTKPNKEKLAFLKNKKKAARKARNKNR